MSSRTLTVKVTGNDAGASKTLRKVGQEAHHTGGIFNELKQHAGALVAGFIGFEAVKKGADFLIDATKAAADDQAQLAILANQANKAGVSWKSHGEAIEETISKMSAASGFMKSDLINSYGRLVTATHSASQSTKLLGDAENVARARHIDLQTASQILIRAHMGNLGALKRLGVAVPGVTKGMTDQQKAVLALAVIHQRYAGAADAFSKTGEGSLARLNAQWELVKVQVGNAVLPILTKLVNWILVNWPKISATFNAVFVRIRALLNQYMPQIRAVIFNTLTTIRQFWDRWGADIKRIATAVMAALKPIIGNALNIIADLFRVVGAVMRGDWSAAWQQIKNIVHDEIAGIKTVLRGAIGAIGAIATSIGRAVFNGIKSGIGDIGGWIVGKIKSAVNAVISRINSILSFRVSFDTHVPGVGKVSFGNSMNIPMLASGGIVNRPTLAVIGEAGPEAVVPLSRGGMGGFQVHFHQVPANADPQAIAAATAWRIRTMASA